MSVLPSFLLYSKKSWQTGILLKYWYVVTIRSWKLSGIPLEQILYALKFKRYLTYLQKLQISRAPIDGHLHSESISGILEATYGCFSQLRIYTTWESLHLHLKCQSFFIYSLSSLWNFSTKQLHINTLANIVYSLLKSYIKRNSNWNWLQTASNMFFGSTNSFSKKLVKILKIF